MLQTKNYQVIGVDEVGIGALAGPAVVAAVLIDNNAVAGVRDSKMVAEDKRYDLARVIQNKAEWYAVTSRDAQYIDTHGIDETWDDMVRLQDAGIYPAAFAAIDVPVLMLHGAEDPHPGSMIRRSLEPHLPKLEYHELQRCGHYPWLEKAARDEFLAYLRDWLGRQP